MRAALQDSIAREASSAQTAKDFQVQLQQETGALRSELDDSKNEVANFARRLQESEAELEQVL